VSRFCFVRFVSSLVDWEYLYSRDAATLGHLCHVSDSEDL